MTAYYNEIDRYAAQWLRNLVERGLIAPGDVDERSILEVKPDDLRGYEQCHFFAGIGGWSYALRLAGVPDDRPVWTGSCPCQPFSAAGKQRGAEDERHLWPAFFRLIRECRPGIVFGEQVAGASGYAWWDHVASDLEVEGYAAAAADIGAHSVGAPHLRQRLYWVANANDPRQCPSGGTVCDERHDAGGGSSDGIMGDASGGRCKKLWRDGDKFAQDAAWRLPDSPWRDPEWLECSDGKARPTQPGIFPLAHGIPARVVRLRGYGNAIVPQVAAAFVRACND